MYDENMVRDSSIALKPILSYSDNNSTKQNSLDIEDETPLIENEDSPSLLSSRNSRRHGSSGNNSYSLIGGRNTQKSRTIPFHASDKVKNKYSPNVIRNQKYNLITFFPLVFYQQFHVFINLYFLLVALSQFIPSLRTGYLITYFGPLCFVILVTMGKEAYDDWIRYRRDRENNSQKYEILTQNGIKIVPSSKIRVGDLVIIHKDQRVPADLILLRTTETGGACFIRTDQLDGETDWKLRYYNIHVAVPFCQKLQSNDNLLEVNADIYAMDNMTPQIEALNVENTLWMNTVLASGTAIGFVIYTGKDTRAVMNTSHPETKIGLLDKEINRLSKILFLVTLLLSFTLIALNNFRGLWYIYLCRFLILFSSIIPIGLRVNLDMGKSVYAYQIMHDNEIPYTIVRTSTIPEELGRINYLLSDKTGTLTKNDMELKKLHMGTMSYSSDTMDEISSQLEIAFGQPGIYKENFFYTTRASTSLQTPSLVGKGRRDMTSRIRDIILALALCHNVTPVIDVDNLVTYQASSPDEVAIVKWTESVGLTLVFRDINEMHLRTPHGNILEFKILQIFPFTSESKRMGIIVQDKQTEEITFYEKGADVVMGRIVQYNDWLDEECGNFAREGLRTLVIARKRLSDVAYNDFQERFHEARTSLTNRKAREGEIISSILEQDLELLGLTGVEDKLQDGVKTTLELLRNAGLKIWMLTGDKIETATCVAISSKLISRNQTIHKIAKMQSSDEALEELDHLQSTGDCCLVIDGESLQLYIDHYKNEFIELAIRLPVVVACRCSPTQKVNNISIWHGRNSYKRSAKLSQFVIHRGLIISVMQAVFSSIFYYAPIALYQGVLMVGYSTVYTMAPVFSLVLDMDVSEDIALQFPELYKDLTKGRSLSLKTFFQWLMISVYQGGAIMIMSIFLFEDEFVNIVSISFTALIINELLMVALEINTW
ncbi:8247_t:CDS:10 [Entrophospora sp. SA101]|nr:8247_t:CDS:10 [Entrophospora sp. SA101]